ncbi:MAG: hypothetical protein OIN89_02585 [Candidatus Methanoperedens sp.]|jgi:hypothetical protein|nr:hypothetical protein [Candidatus Methanoperedens sp.]PKL54278.1 MAG: hypothetical protein CVV36_02545 [Candidatus Methanoperedenaceae archaeon HGW-Methanoperedenaceae-1]
MSYIAKIRIVDPDVIDRVRVEKKNSANNTTIRQWELGNFQSTEDIDLDGGKIYLKLTPYIDPLPVWFKVFNHGDKKLIAKCVLSELQQEGGKQFKDLGIIERNKTLYVPACLGLEYRVLRFWLGSLDVRKLNAVTIKHWKELVKENIITVKGLVDANRTTIIRIFGKDADAVLISAKTLCDASIAEEFWRIENRHPAAIVKLSESMLAKEAVVSDEKARTLLSLLKYINQALVPYVFETLLVRDLMEV